MMVCVQVTQRTFRATNFFTIRPECTERFVKFSVSLDLCAMELCILGSVSISKSIEIKTRILHLFVPNLCYKHMSLM